MSAISAATTPLEGFRVVELSSFVAVPLAGMTLSQLGCEVIRIDPIGGAADYQRWPVADSGASIYWAGLNKGKRSVAVDLRSPEGRVLVQRLVTESGPRGGILITNVVGRDWHSYEALVSMRPDLIHLEVSGRGDGSTGVDYTVNAGVGFPMVTGDPSAPGPVNHVLPAWDVTCGLYAALAITAAVRHREATGQGSRIRLPLEDVALATASNLGFLTEPMVNGRQRERLGNAIYGQYGQDFTSQDGVSFMVVALTGRHIRDLATVTGTTEAVAALAQACHADFADEGDRYRHRDALTGLFASWFANRRADQISADLSTTSVLWERYRTFAQTAIDPRVTDSSLFTRVHQPRIGDYRAAGSPISVDGAHSAAVAAPTLGDDTLDVLVERLAMSPDDVHRLRESGIVATA